MPCLPQMPPALPRTFAGGEFQVPQSKPSNPLEPVWQGAISPVRASDALQFFVSQARVLPAAQGAWAVLDPAVEDRAEAREDATGALLLLRTSLFDIVK